MSLISPSKPLPDLGSTFPTPTDRHINLQNPFETVTISGNMDENCSKNTYFDSVIRHPSISQFVRHINVQHVLNDESAEDPYAKQLLPKLFKNCTKLESASFQAFRPSRYIDSELYQSFASSHLTVLEIIGLQGDDISKLCKFLSAFPNLKDINKFTGCDFDDLRSLHKRNLPETSIEFYYEELGRFASRRFKALKTIRSVRFQVQSDSDGVFIDLLGSTLSIFPRLERLYYGRYAALDHLSRLLKQLEGSLKVLQLPCGPLVDIFTSSDILIIPPLLERLDFILYPPDALSPGGDASLRPAGPAFYARSLKEFGRTSELGHVQIILNHTATLDFGELEELDDVLSSNELGVKYLEVIIAGPRATDTQQELARWDLFLDTNLPKVGRRFFGNESVTNGQKGIIRWVSEHSI